MHQCPDATAGRLNSIPQIVSGSLSVYHVYCFIFMHLRVPDGLVGGVFSVPSWALLSCLPVCLFVCSCAAERLLVILFMYLRRQHVSGAFIGSLCGRAFSRFSIALLTNKSLPTAYQNSLKYSAGADALQCGHP